MLRQRALLALDEGLEGGGDAILLGPGDEVLEQLQLRLLAGPGVVGAATRAELALGEVHDGLDVVEAVAQTLGPRGGLTVEEAVQEAEDGAQVEDQHAGPAGGVRGADGALRDVEGSDLVAVLREQPAAVLEGGVRREGDDAGLGIDIDGEGTGAQLGEESEQDDSRCPGKPGTLGVD